MDGGDSEFADFTLPTLKAFLEARSQNVSGCRMPQNAFFPRTCNLLARSAKKHDAKTLFFPTLHPLSPVIFATATVVAFVPLRNSRFNFHCYTQREATPTQKWAWEWRCDLSRLLARKITKGIHSCKPASQNRALVRQRQGLDGDDLIPKPSVDGRQASRTAWRRTSASSALSSFRRPQKVEWVSEWDGEVGTWVGA